MPATPLDYNDAIQENKRIGDDLGLLLGTIDKGKDVYEKAPNSYYMGAELLAVGETAPPGCEFRKKDVAGGSGGGRTQNRVIVAVNKTTGLPVEGLAYYWRHDGRVLKLAPGFFQKAKAMRDFSKTV